MKSWMGRKVLVIGAARQGLALARYLASHGALVILNDQRDQDGLRSAQEELLGLNIAWQFGGHSLDLLDGVDLVCPSGGVSLALPLVVDALRRGIPLSNDSQIFMEVVPCRVIAITGSAGKTTTTTLVGRMAQAAANATPGMGRIFVGGNIGLPLISFVDEMTKNDLVVMELSSFQLEIMSRSPDVAAILNITPNHLDRHATMQAYQDAKAHILSYQQPDSVAVLGHGDPGAWSLCSQVRGRLFSFGFERPPSSGEGSCLESDQLVLYKDGQRVELMTRQLIRLRGSHNILNVLAACAIAAACGFNPGSMREGVRDFAGVDHRLQWVRRCKGVDWYNDSIATAPERAIASIQSFNEPLVLLAGGRDKNLPWQEFARLVRQRIEHLILFGEAAGLIAQQVENCLPGPGDRLQSVVHCRGLQEAVQAAAGLAEPGDVVLLAPGGTSFDEFNDFEERGEWFKTWVNALV
jgi:UDP-N-acetylmuramoylalanine--D-glutamate ligase